MLTIDHCPQDWANAPRLYAVYSHALPATGPKDDWPPVWIGYCRLSAVLTAPDAHLSPAWCQHVLTAPVVRLTIHSTHDSPVYALRDAMRLVRLHRPRINQLTGARGSGTSRRVMCVETGESWPTAAAAAAANGIHPAQMSEYLNNPQRGGVIRGRTYIRC